MKPKEIELLNILKSSDNWLTAKELAKQLKVSVRSVHNYIHHLKKVEQLPIESSSQGFQLDKSGDSESISLDNFASPNTPEERITYLTTLLVTHPSDQENPFDLIDIGEELDVSESTVRLDLQKIKRLFTKNKVTLKIEKNKFWVEGSEKDKRKLVSNILYAENSEQFMDISTLEEAFPGFDIYGLAKDVSVILESSRYFINDYAFVNLMLHIMVVADRLHSGFQSIPFSNQKDIPVDYQQIAAKIAESIRKILKVTFDDNEINQLAMLLLVRTNRVDPEKMSIDTMHQIVSKEYIDFTEKTIAEINDYFKINLDDDMFFVRLTLHINNLVLRCKMKYSNHNPLLQSIKMNCPMIYEVGILLSKRIQETFHVKLSEGEIAFITMHLGGEIENKKNFQKKIKCYLLFPEYNGMSFEVANRIKKMFNRECIILGVLNTEKELENTVDYDLLITTTAIVQNNVPVVQITPFLTSQDVTKLSNQIQIIKDLVEVSEFKKNLGEVFSEKLFKKDTILDNHNDVIHEISSQLFDLGYVDQHYEAKLLEREEMSPTCFGNVALPHTIKLDAKKTGIFVWLNEKGIDWGNEKVNLVFALSINYENRYDFRNILNSLTMLLSDETVVVEIAKCKTFDAFFEKMYQLLHDR